MYICDYVLCSYVFMHAYMNVCTYVGMHVWLDGRINGWMDGWVSETHNSRANELCTVASNILSIIIEIFP